MLLLLYNTGYYTILLLLPLLLLLLLLLLRLRLPLLLLSLLLNTLHGALYCSIGSAVWKCVNNQTMICVTYFLHHNLQSQ